MLATLKRERDLLKDRRVFHRASHWFTYIQKFISLSLLLKNRYVEAMSKKRPRGRIQRLEHEICGLILMYEFNTPLMKDYWESACICDPLDLMNEAKSYEMLFWLMIK